MFVFGDASEKNLKNVHKDLVLIHRTAIKTIKVDYGIHCGSRTFKEQLDCFLEGTSKLDPRIPAQLAKAKHVITPNRPYAMATDIHVAARYMGKELTWNAIHLTYIAGYLIAIADVLYDAGKIQHKLRWGGNWDNNSIIQLDETFIDNPHLELYIP